MCFLRIGVQSAILEIHWRSDLRSARGGGVDDPGREESEPGEGPGEGEHHERGVAGGVPAGVAEELGQLEPVVGEVVDQEDQGAHPVHVVGPAEGEQGQGRHVVDEHLPEVLEQDWPGFQMVLDHLSLDIKELGDEEGPVEGHLQHVVPPDGRIWNSGR